MKVSLLKIARKKEVIKRIELEDLAEMIRKNPEEDKVFSLRLSYQFMKPQRIEDGRIIIDEAQHLVNLPRILFAADSMNYKEMQKGLKYNGLAVVEVNGLKTYEEAVQIRNQAARMDETVMAFLGASGKSGEDCLSRGVVCLPQPLRRRGEASNERSGNQAVPQESV